MRRMFDWIKGANETMPNTLEPSQIFAEVNACPPLMREQTKAKYLGQEVIWNGLFADGYEDQLGQARISLYFDQNDVRIIVASIVLLDYPWLKSMPAGSPLNIRGRISKIGALSIELDHSILSLAETVEAAR